MKIMQTGTGYAWCVVLVDAAELMVYSLSDVGHETIRRIGRGKAKCLPQILELERGDLFQLCSSNEKAQFKSVCL